VYFAITLSTRQNDKAELQPFFKRILEERNAREGKYMALIDEIRFDEVLSPAFATKDLKSGFKESLRRIDAMVSTQKAFNDEQLGAMNGIERRIDMMNISNSAKASIRQRLPQVQEMQNHNLVIVRDECSKAREMVIFLRDNAKNWKVTNDTFVFDDDRLLAKYQSLTEEFNALVQQQNKLVEEFATARGKAEELFRD
jgi:hypothetical protein